MSEAIDFKLLLQTDERHLFDAADLALEEAGIPHDLAAYDITGMRDQINFSEAFPTPGSSWTIVVPAEHLDKAQAVIDQLPWDFAKKPDTWDCCDPTTTVTKPWLVIFVWTLAAIVALLLIAMLRSLLFDGLEINAVMNCNTSG